MFEMNGKVAVVTGASSGLGNSAARAYAEAGASVAILARRKEKLDTLAKELADQGCDVLAVACDVSDEKSVEAAVAEVIAKFGKIDILLNNAGVAVRGGVHDMTEEDWDKSMNTNVKSIFLMSKYVVPQMMENKYGKIVNIASVNAVVGDKPDAFIRHSYNASKSAVLGLTMGMACSYGKYNITVNAIGPGLFESEMTADTLFKSKEILTMYNQLIPMDRPGRPGELNGTVLYLSSEASSFVTGQFIKVTGGWELV